MSKPSDKPNRTIAATQVLEALLTVLRPRLPLKVQATRITATELWTVLAYAAVHQTSPEAACTLLAGAPSGNRLREVLTAALPTRAILQRQLNTVLRAQLPKPLLQGKRSYCLAGDTTLIPYHGQPAQAASELVRGPSKGGTTRFHGYATLAVVHHHQRYILALKFLQAGETVSQTLRWLLDRAQRLNISVRRLYLDKGFCNQHVFRLLDRRGYSYIVPMAVYGKKGGVRRLWHGRSTRTTYTLRNKVRQTYTVQVAVVRRRGHKRQFKWFVYAVAGLPARLPLGQIYQLYRQRFGIESSYRQLHQVRARTSSRNPALRLLLVGLAFILINLYIALRSRLTQPHQVGWFSLPRLKLCVGHAVDDWLGCAPILQCRASPLLS